MSIPEKVTALESAKSDIYNALVQKGATISEGAGFGSFAAAIASIPVSSGGGKKVQVLTGVATHLVTFSELTTIEGFLYTMWTKPTINYDAFLGGYYYNGGKSIKFSMTESGTAEESTSYPTISGNTARISYSYGGESRGTYICVAWGT